MFLFYIFALGLERGHDAKPFIILISNDNVFESSNA